ncbi:MAG: hypothetical protein ACON4M_05310 [Crocinitomicaceae bacterium]
MISKLLFQGQNKKQLLIASLGLFLGILFLLISIHYWVKIQEIGKEGEVLGTNTLIVQKKVSSSSSLKLSKTDFSLNEILKIKSESFIKNVAPIKSNNFNVSFQTSDPLVPYFRSDIFIQALDKEFLDIKIKNWTWDSEKDEVPMIMPREFLVMLNTFMSAKGIPQVSDELAKEIKFQFKIWNKNKVKYFNVRIVGFTNEVSSVLVPMEFMDFSAANFGGEESQKVTQVIIQGKEGEFGLVEKLLIKRGLEPKKSQLIVGRLKSVVQTLFIVVLIIALTTLLLSSLILIQFLQLLVSRNSYNIQTLIRIGFDHKKMIKLFVKYLVLFFAAVSFFTIVVFGLVKFSIDGLFQKGGLYLSDSFSFLSLFILFFVFLLFVISVYRTAKKEILKHYH